MDLAIQVQILDDAICISLCTNALGKGMNPSVLSQTTGKIVGQTVFFIFCKVDSLQDRISTILDLRIDLVLYAAFSGGVG